MRRTLKKSTIPGYDKLIRQSASTIVCVFSQHGKLAEHDCCQVVPFSDFLSMWSFLRNVYYDSADRSCIKQWMN
jgi:hypothetical protein